MADNENLHMLRCVGGPWAEQDKLWNGESLEVAGHPEGRYVGWPMGNPMTLVWSENPEFQ